MVNTILTQIDKSLAVTRGMDKRLPFEHVAGEVVFPVLAVFRDCPAVQGLLHDVVRGDGVRVVYHLLDRQRVTQAREWALVGDGKELPTLADKLTRILDTVDFDTHVVGFHWTVDGKG